MPYFLRRRREVTATMFVVQMCVEHRCVNIDSLNITTCGHCNNHGVSSYNSKHGNTVGVNEKSKRELKRWVKKLSPRNSV